MLALLLEIGYEFKEWVFMRYINANAILPKELVEKLQNFVQGEYLYIPAIKDQHKHWGNYPVPGRKSIGETGTSCTLTLAVLRFKNSQNLTAFRFMPSEKSFTANKKC